MRLFSRLGVAAFFALALVSTGICGESALSPVEGDFTIADFRFGSGESLAELRLHYMTLGTLRRDEEGHAANAVVILHGTGGSGQQFLRAQFADVLFAPGGILDPAKYFIVLPDAIGHGKSSKPSDGLRARFPHYDYDDMVKAQHTLLVDGLKADHARLVMGTSMGCMHSFVWGETYPDFMDALMPLACLPVAIAGRNRMWRKMLMDAITTDPDWKGGDYTEAPVRALRTASDLLVLAGSAPLFNQKNQGTRELADAYVEERTKANLESLDANDLLYQVAASRHYDPSPKLETIRARVLWINSADDFINPPELGLAEREAKRLRNGRFVLLPISEATRGHGTHSWAAVWKDYLAALLAEPAKAR